VNQKPTGIQKIKIRGKIIRNSIPLGMNRLRKKIYDPNENEFGFLGSKVKEMIFKSKNGRVLEMTDYAVFTVV